MAGAMMVERAGSIPTMEPLDVEVYLAKLEEEQANEMDEEQLKENESKIMDLGHKYREQGNAEDLGRLIKRIRPFTKLLSKAKGAKLIRGLVDMYLDMGADTGYEVTLCKECITWATEEKRIFLRQALEARLIGLYYGTGNYQAVLSDGAKLLKELKKLDDKNLLVEVQLLESKTYHALSDLPRARAALTSARSTANSIYVPPRIQAQLDLQSGILHASEENDFKTAFSYFFEAFEQYDIVEDAMATKALKYMLLSKVMLNLPDEVTNLVSGKLALRHSGPEMESMKAVAQAAKARSLAGFQKAVKTFRVQLEDDMIVAKHLATLYSNMLEHNLCRIIEPYSEVQVDYVAGKIRLPKAEVEKKLSQMILDKKVLGILDQETGVLYIFTKESSGMESSDDDRMKEKKRLKKEKKKAKKEKMKQKIRLEAEREREEEERKEKERGRKEEDMKRELETWALERTQTLREDRKRRDKDVQNSRKGNSSSRSASPSPLQKRGSQKGRIQKRGVLADLAEYSLTQAVKHTKSETVKKQVQLGLTLLGFVFLAWCVGFVPAVVVKEAVLVLIPFYIAYWF